MNLITITRPFRGAIERWLPLSNNEAEAADSKQIVLPAKLNDATNENIVNSKLADFFLMLKPKSFSIVSQSCLFPSLS